MANELQGMWTAKGLEKLARHAAGGTALMLRELALGDGGGSPAPAPAPSWTALTRQVWRGMVNGVQTSPDNASQVQVDAVIPLNIGGFFIREWGLYDAEGDMVAVGAHAEFYKPVISSGASAEIVERILLPIANAGAITLTIASQAVATQQFVQAQVKAHDESPTAHGDMVRRLEEHTHPRATEDAAGLVELATMAEVLTGTDADRSVTPATLANLLNNLTTPAQFTNDRKAATTEFVQRALGNFAGLTGYAKNTVLGAIDCGRIIFVQGAGLTFTLPPTSSVPQGAVIEIYGNGAGVTVARQGTDTLVNGLAGGAATTITIGGYDSARFVAVSTAWYVLGGSIHLAGTSNMNASLNSNGFQRFPSGLIWQWMHITDAIAAGGSRTLTLPFAFPASVLFAHATARNGQQAGAGTISVVPSGLQSVIVYNNGSVVNGAFLTALGF
ncbi:phage tail protein [Nitratidesulfovibrio vulgaris]|uniref:phage tail protein n=1 Tax=Nitratidesulfovibrio vulgaris TaxID=881 RepID=UPI001F14B8C8|nr:phage tail protein [Nitratidesulfovibrio vulgaris]